MSISTMRVAAPDGSGFACRNHCGWCCNIMSCKHQTSKHHRERPRLIKEEAARNQYCEYYKLMITRAPEIAARNHSNNVNARKYHMLLTTLLKFLANIIRRNIIAKNKGTLPSGEVYFVGRWAIFSILYYVIKRETYEISRNRQILCTQCMKRHSRHFCSGEAWKYACLIMASKILRPSAA